MLFTLLAFACILFTCFKLDAELYFGMKTLNFELEVIPNLFTLLFTFCLHCLHICLLFTGMGDYGIVQNAMGVIGHNFTRLFGSRVTKVGIASHSRNGRASKED